MKLKEVVVNPLIETDRISDVERIIAVLKENGYKILDAQAYLCWKTYSDDHANSWLPLPKDNKNLLNIVMRYCEVKQ